MKCSESVDFMLGWCFCMHSDINNCDQSHAVSFFINQPLTTFSEEEDINGTAISPAILQSKSHVIEFYMINS